MGIELAIGDIDGKLAIGILILVGIVTLVRFFFSESAVTKRRLKRSPCFAIEEFPDGAAGKIVGVLRYVGKPLRAPLSRRSCSCYYVVVEESDDDSSTTLVEEKDYRDFMLEDGTGRALVKVHDPKIAVAMDVRKRSGTFKDASPRLERFLNKHGYESKGILGFNRSLSYEEGVLEKGERVAVFGVGRWSSQPDQEKLLVMEGTRAAPLRISDNAKVL